MQVFRNASIEASAAERKADLLTLLRRLVVSTGHDELIQNAIRALLRAGELECSLADAKHQCAATMARVTDLLAAVVVAAPGSGSAQHAVRALAIVKHVRLPGMLRFTPHEGFAYYAVHPRHFVDLVARITASTARGPVAVIGVRSIGSTLSAIVTAALRERGRVADRTTVRPAGHPFARDVQWTPDQLGWIQKRAAHSDFHVVHEGPGLSGSTFLAVGDSLVRNGVDRERVLFLTTHTPDPDALAATDGARRWHSFDSHAIHYEAHRPRDAGVRLEAGEWRRWTWQDEADWPAAWPQTERMKFLSSDGRRLFKFEGLGHYGEPAIARAELIAQAGFGCALRDEGDGYASTPMLPFARACSIHDLTIERLDRIADYCAFRASAMACAPVPPVALAEMARINAEEEFGAPVPTLPEIEIVRPVIADARMSPHEWLRTLNGRFIKTDAASHGDDHFFPGPTDIAWDLAGVIVEWQLDSISRAAFLDRYRRISGDDPTGRLCAYEIAYALARLGYSRLAARAMARSPEEKRLAADCARYRQVVERWLWMRCRSARGSPG